MTRELKGWHVAAIFVSGFAVIIYVNLTLAWNAVQTFPGLEVKNSYIASQAFDRKRAAQQALGWEVTAEARHDHIRLTFADASGAMIQPASLNAVLGRATHVHADQHPAFTFDGAAYVAPADLGEGYWNLRLKAVAADGTVFEQRITLWVNG